MIRCWIKCGFFVTILNQPSYSLSPYIFRLAVMLIVMALCNSAVSFFFIAVLKKSKPYKFPSAMPINRRCGYFCENKSPTTSRVIPTPYYYTCVCARAPGAGCPQGKAAWQI